VEEPCRTRSWHHLGSRQQREAILIGELSITRRRNGLASESLNEPVRVGHVMTWLLAIDAFAVPSVRGVTELDQEGGPDRCRKLSTLVTTGVTRFQWRGRLANARAKVWRLQPKVYHAIVRIFRCSDNRSNASVRTAPANSNMDGIWFQVRSTPKQGCTVVVSWHSFSVDCEAVAEADRKILHEQLPEPLFQRCMNRDLHEFGIGSAD